MGVWPFSDFKPVSPFSTLSIPTPFGGYFGHSHVTQPLVMSASDLLAHIRRHPFKSRSTKLKEAYERAPLQLDLLPFVQISSEPIKLTGHIPAISVPSVVIYNPELNGGHAAARIAEYVAFLRAHLDTRES